MLHTDDVAFEVKPCVVRHAHKLQDKIEFVSYTWRKVRVEKDSLR